MKKQLTKGFTLIELLVVVAIIGLLSSIVLAALGEARDKGEDSKKLQMVSEWKKALELYYDANGAYPATSALTSNSANYACLGTGYTGTTCAILGEVVNEPNNSLTTYYPTPIPSEYDQYGIFNAAGIGYRCYNDNSDCLGYRLFWLIKTSSGSCGEGSLTGTDYGSGQYYECALEKLPN